MVARDPFTGQTTTPTPRDKDGNPVDPHIGTLYDNNDRPQQTVLTGYARGGTTNPPVGDDGAPKHFAPAAGDDKLGAVPGGSGVGRAESADKHFERAAKLAENEQYDLESQIEENATQDGAYDTRTGEQIDAPKKGS